MLKVNLFTIGFTKKTAEQFFTILREHSIDLLVDVRLNNKSQLAGFSKGDDFAFFLKEICDCEYEYRADLAPTKEILDDYKGKRISWLEYEERYTALIVGRNAAEDFVDRYGKYKNIVLLCSEPTAEQCHRRLAAELIVKVNTGITLTHI
jgi:uncharacterized protein (DUF488 family)